MAGSISAVVSCPGRHRNRWLNMSPNANRTVESSSLKKKPDPDARDRGGLGGWIDRRYQLTPLFEFLRHKEVPLGSHWMGWYYLGGVTMFFFIVQVITGVLLLMYYQPGEATAYESIRFLTTKVPFGWLIRSVHSWSAHLMIISLVLHMFSTMMLKAYRPPREITWVSGYFLFLLTLGFGFSGYLLPWNKLAYFATTVGTNIVRSVPVLGQLAPAGVARRAGCDDQHALSVLCWTRGHSAAGVRWHYCSPRHTDSTARDGTTRWRDQAHHAG